MHKAAIAIDTELAYQTLKNVVVHTPLQYNAALSQQYQCNVYLKREDLQIVRSYKLRGAYYKMSQLSAAQLNVGVVCASAGNHAQGVAYSCKLLKTNGTIFMPSTTPQQKIQQTKKWGQHYITIQLIGDTFDDCATAALAYCNQHQKTFIHPFDDEAIIAGQATVAHEIFNDIAYCDIMFIPVGGGGLSAGIASYCQQQNLPTKLIGVEPAGAPSMQKAIAAGQPVLLNTIDKFVDGAAVKQVGQIPFKICKDSLSEIITVPEGKICSSILQLYNNDAIVAEPAGALAVAALDFYKAHLIGKTVVCIIGGGNNDIERMAEIQERSLQYEGLKHYFLIKFAQRPGALKEFVSEILGPNDDIVRFEYLKKTNKEAGPALVGIENKAPEDFNLLLEKLDKAQINYSILNEEDSLLQYVV
jgi:threonine dehydratase